MGNAERCRLELRKRVMKLLTAVTTSLKRKLFNAVANAGWVSELFWDFKGENFLMFRVERILSEVVESEVENITILKTNKFAPLEQGTANPSRYKTRKSHESRKTHKSTKSNKKFPPKLKQGFRIASSNHQQWANISTEAEPL